MTRLRRVLVMSLLIGSIAWCSAPPAARAAADAAPDGAALIETTVLLEDPSDAGIRAAVDRAIDNAVRGAVAMGLSWVQLQRAYVAGGYVGVQVLAATRPPAAEVEDEPASGAVPDRHVSGALSWL
jgi:hypothetical protein